MPKYFNKTAGTHESNREKVCVWCFKKENRCKTAKFVKIAPQSKIEEMINVHVSFDVAGQHHLPSALCGGCLRNLYRMKNGTVDTIDKPDFSRFEELRKSRTGKRSPCNCTICCMVKTPLIKKRSIQKNSVSAKDRTASIRSKNTKQNLCSICFTTIARGKRHNCNSSTRIENIKLMVQHGTSSKGRDQIISSLLKGKIAETGSKEMLLSQRAGRPLKVAVNPKKEDRKETLLSTDDVLKIQTSLSLTQNETLGIAAMLRSGTGNRKFIEPNLKHELSTRIHSLDKYFEVKTFEFVKTKGNITTVEVRDAACCKNLSGLIELVVVKRGVDKVHLKFSIDGGGGFLKLCLSIQEIRDHVPDTGRQKYTHGIASKQFLDTGVKKLFVIGAAQSTQENHRNVLQLWSASDINTSLAKFKGTIAADLKLANVISGIMAHSSKHPCTYCIAPKDSLINSAELRTIGSNLKNYSEWVKAGALPQLAKFYKCCTHPPIFTGHPDMPILEIMPPPELHLMLGVVNTIYNKMVTEFEEVSLAWAKSCNVISEVRNGSSGFNGNNCKKLLEKVDILRASCPIGCLKFVRVFQDFHRVVKACFSTELDPNYKQFIDDFKKSYIALEASITPKVHAVLHHVIDYCSKEQKGLGFVSEQAAESVHCDFNKVWSKYAVPVSHSEYQQHLLRAICEYNALHV